MNRKAMSLFFKASAFIAGVLVGIAIYVTLIQEWPV